MPALKISLEGREHLVDLDSLMLSELEVLEEHAGVELDQLNNKESLKKIRFMGHMLWLVRLREIAADKSIPLVEAALVLPRSEFDIGTGSIQMELVDAPKSPAGPRTRTTRTRRTGSSAPRKPSAKSGGAKPADSPSS